MKESLTEHSGFGRRIQINIFISYYRKWKIGLNLPALRSSGVYKLYGTIPPNLDLDTSTGDVRLKAKQVDLDIEVGLGIRDGDKLEAKTFDLNLALDDINVEMECLFPRNGRCCPRKFLKSCNSILAKTVLRLTQNYYHCDNSYCAGLSTMTVKSL